MEIFSFLQESDCESSVGSPEPGSLIMGSDTGTDLTVSSKHIHSRMDELNSTQHKTNLSPSITPSTHLNGASKFTRNSNNILLT